ncbi:PEP-CTERM sorting domain-containing protein [Candidatus Nitrospira nitrosa]|nr:PEP-CTERM sorting domain-containing protein [Candidatus Nitrospira nitrosa]
MKLSIIKSMVCSLAVLMAGVSWVGGAQATLVACTADMADNFSGSDGCQYVTPFTGPGNDSQNLVNNQGFFGSSDWTLNGSVGNSSLLSGTQSGQSGTFSITGLAADLDALVIIKGGQGSTLVGYLYEADANGTYSWTSPYIGIFAQNGNPKDVSHFSLYTRESPGIGNDPVPEPASMLLLGSGLVALGLWRRSSGKS